MSTTDYVVGFLFTADREHVVLVVKQKPGWQAGRFNGVGGKKEPEESWEDCMVREFREETGVLIPATLWQHTVTLKNSYFECRFFRAFSDLAYTVRTVETEEIRRMTLWDFRVLQDKEIVPNLRWLVPMQLDFGLHVPVMITDG